MALFDTLGAAIYTQIGIKGEDGTGTPGILDIPGLRGTPEIGTEANIFSIPGFNQATAGSGVGQADLPQMDLEINYRPGDALHQVLSHLAGILQTPGATTATVTEGANTQTFTPGQVCDFTMQLSQTAAKTDVAVFTFKAVVASFATSPAVDDQSIATVSLALQEVPVGPDGTAAVFTVGDSVAFT